MKLSRFVAELILVENCGPTGYPAVSAHAALQNFAPEPGPGAAAIKPALKKAAAAPAAAPGFAFAVGANALGAILDKRTFAAPLAQLSAMRRIDASTLLFCVDRGSRELLGVFRGNGRAGTDLEPAFGPLRAQIRFTGAAARVTVAGALPAGALSVEETIRCAELLRISGEAL
ncbi:hypothetical protein M885DRAFT_152994 [Pelagophyceae sp. CCMP2097]|nr:hypothetical protein M885DRAFT_152994 [Pelagophyceae sp. CCMP2097]